MGKKHKAAKVTGIAFAALLLAVPAASRAQEDETKNFTPEQIQAGSQHYARHCSPCHGMRMADPEGAFDLRKFPHDQRERFVTSVTNGKASMPPWGSLLTPDDVGNLWAYVMAGEKQ